MEEYFPMAQITEEELGHFIMEFTAPAHELGWKGLLFTYGGKLKILEPQELQIEFRDKKEVAFD